MGLVLPVSVCVCARRVGHPAAAWTTHTRLLGPETDSPHGDPRLLALLKSLPLVVSWTAWVSVLFGGENPFMPVDRASDGRVRAARSGTSALGTGSSDAPAGMIGAPPPNQSIGGGACADPASGAVVGPHLSKWGRCAGDPVRTGSGASRAATGGVVRPALGGHRSGTFPQHGNCGVPTPDTLELPLTPRKPCSPIGGECAGAPVYPNHRSPGPGSEPMGWSALHRH